MLSRTDLSIFKWACTNANGVNASHCRSDTSETRSARRAARGGNQPGEVSEVSLYYARQVKRGGREKPAARRRLRRGYLDLTLECSNRTRCGLPLQRESGCGKRA